MRKYTDLGCNELTLVYYS